MGWLLKLIVLETFSHCILAENICPQKSFPSRSQRQKPCNSKSYSYKHSCLFFTFKFFLSDSSKHHLLQHSLTLIPPSFHKLQLCNEPRNSKQRSQRMKSLLQDSAQSIRKRLLELLTFQFLIFRNKTQDSELLIIFSCMFSMSIRKSI